MATKILICGGRLIDPANGIDELNDLLIVDGKVERIGKIDKVQEYEIIDASGKIVCPGLIDLQVHLREPGREDKETIETGMRAAIAGGITSVVAMPNLNPTADNQAVIGFQLRRAAELKLANLYPTASITTGQKGERLTEMREVKLEGAVAVTDDGVDVQSAGLLLKAMEWAKTFDLPVLSHCEEESLREAGVMHEGEWSTRLALPGISAATEDYGVFRSLLLAEKSGVRFHAMHCSTAYGLELIAAAKARSKNITAETCPQYFALTDAICDGYNTNAKMYPPIRSEDHRKAVIARLKDGTIDCISTDHAPHLHSEKLKPFTEANPGSVGLETSLAVSITHLVDAGHLSLSELIRKMALNPAKVLRLDRGHLAAGAIADITVFDPHSSWTVDPQKFYSKGKNSVFAGMKVKGKVSDVLVGGEIKFRAGSFVV